MCQLFSDVCGSHYAVMRLKLNMLFSHSVWVFLLRSLSLRCDAMSVCSVSGTVDEDELMLFDADVVVDGVLKSRTRPS